MRQFIRFDGNHWEIKKTDDGLFHLFVKSKTHGTWISFGQLTTRKRCFEIITGKTLNGDPEELAAYNLAASEFSVTTEEE